MARTHATAQAYPVPPADHPHFAAPSFPLQCVREERGVTGHAFMTGSGRRHHSGAVVRAGVRGRLDGLPTRLVVTSGQPRAVVP